MVVLRTLRADDEGRVTLLVEGEALADPGTPDRPANLEGPDHRLGLRRPPPSPGPRPRPSVSAGC